MIEALSTMGRRKTQTSFALDPAVLARLDAWLAAQEFPPTKTAAVEAAIRLFVDVREGRIECRPVAPKPAPGAGTDSDGGA